MFFISIFNLVRLVKVLIICLSTYNYFLLLMSTQTAEYGYSCYRFCRFYFIALRRLISKSSITSGRIEEKTYKYSACGTTVAISAFQHQFGVTVAHFPCNKTCPADLLRCSDLDISLIKKCPPTSFSLDASQYTEPLVGDELNQCPNCSLG